MAKEVLAAVEEARGNVQRFLRFLCTKKKGRRLTGASNLWPIRETIRAFLVHPTETLKLLKWLEPVLQQRQEAEA